MSKQIQTMSNPAQLLQIAVENKYDLDMVSKLITLSNEWEDRQARKLFDEAFSKFQYECPTIIKRKQGHNYKFAPLGDIINQVKLALFENSLSFRFEQKHEKGIIRITCVATHAAGYSRSTWMESAAETSGSKNNIQAIGSAVQYLQRYTFCSLLGIATADEDIDGRVDNGVNLISDDECIRLEELLAKHGRSCEKLLKHFKVKEIKDLPRSQFQQALIILSQSKAK